MVSDLDIVLKPETMKKFRAIGFDYGGVIGGGPRIGKNFTADVCDLLGIDEQKYRKVYFSLNHLLNTGKVAHWYEFWKLFLHELHLFSEQNVTQLTSLSQKYAKLYIQTDSKIIDLIDKLRAMGYKVGLLSNATKENGQQMRDAKLDLHFDCFLISAEIRVQKPDPQSFKPLAQKLDTDIHELIYIDDAEVSLSTAEICGYTPILFKSHEELLSSLSDLNIL